MFTFTWEIQSLAMVMDKPCWAESLQPRGVYFVDDATATVERYKAEALTTFGTQTSKLSRDDPEVQQTRSRALENCYHMTGA